MLCLCWWLDTNLTLLYTPCKVLTDRSFMSKVVSAPLNALSQSRNPKQITGKAKLLVDTLVSRGCSITEASKLAGYKGNSARVSASKMLRKPEVQQYMAQEIQRSLGIHSAKASSRLLQLCQGAKSEYVQLEAAKDSHKVSESLRKS